VAQASLLLDEMQPRHVLRLDEPAFAAHSEADAASSPEATVQAASATISDGVGAVLVDVRCSSAVVQRLPLHEALRFSFKTRFVLANMPAAAARAVTLRALPRGVRGSRVRVAFHRTDDGSWLLLPCGATTQMTVGDDTKDEERDPLYGEPDASTLLLALRKRGLRPVLHQGPPAVVTLAGLVGARVELRPDESTLYVQHPSHLSVSLLTEALREQLL